TAILALVLFSAGALAIDLGNAYSRARSQQARADLAALSAGDLLPVKDDATKLKVAKRIADYLNDTTNAIQNDGGDNASHDANHDFTGQGLLESGAVTFSTDGSKVTFDAPKVQVDFGLANAFGAHSIDVSRKATVGVFSISESAVAPLYAVAGCDYGSQVLKDSPNGKSKDELSIDDTSDISTAISVTDVSPASVAVDAAAPVITISGDLILEGKNKNFPDKPIDAVGFFRDNTTNASPTNVVVTSLMSLTATSVKVQVPATVMTQSGWLIRVRQGSSWSDINTSATFTVGQAPTATCPAASNGGNFGQLNFGDVNNPNEDIAQVFKKGPAKNIVAYPGSFSPAQCDGSSSDEVIYNHIVDNANCVETEPGFKPNAATDGLISQTDSRLRKSTSPLCGSSQTTAGGYPINNDYLSCFLKDDTTTLGTIESGSYDGGPVLSPDIVKSPRFFIVPVFAADPGNGKKAFKITGFRPAFLTDQPASATRNTGPNAGNGITTCCGNKVQSLNFILFSEKALPDTLDSGLPTSPTYAFGPKVIKLID
ncbi:MAG: hypothetical protein ACTHOK_16260, partial [Nocardioidaceae bacterium]